MTELAAALFGAAVFAAALTGFAPKAALPRRPAGPLLRARPRRALRNA